MRKRGEKLVDRHIWLREDDWEFLTSHCGRGEVGMSPGEIIRAIVHQKVKWLKAKEIERIDELGPGEEERNRKMRELLENTTKSPEELGF